MLLSVFAFCAGFSVLAGKPSVGMWIAGVLVAGIIIFFLVAIIQIMQNVGRGPP
jgi:hypothetical protein